MFFFLQITNVDTEYIRTIDNLIATRISLKMQLQGIHFSSVNPAIYNNVYGLNSIYGHGGPVYAPNSNPGGLLLRCSAQIGDLYQEYKEIELGTPQKDPVPARGKCTIAASQLRQIQLTSVSGFSPSLPLSRLQSRSHPTRAWRTFSARISRPRHRRHRDSCPASTWRRL